MIEPNHRHFLLFHRVGPEVTSPVVSSRQGVIQVFVEWVESSVSRFLARKLEQKKERMQVQASTYSPLSHRGFFSFFLSQISLPLHPITPQRGATAHLFQFKSALSTFKYLLNESNLAFLQLPYLTLFFII